MNIIVSFRNFFFIFFSKLKTCFFLYIRIFVLEELLELKQDAKQKIYIFFKYYLLFEESIIDFCKFIWRLFNRMGTQSDRIDHRSNFWSYKSIYGFDRSLWPIDQYPTDRYMTGLHDQKLDRSSITYQYVKPFSSYDIVNSRWWLHQNQQPFVILW